MLVRIAVTLALGFGLAAPPADAAAPDAPVAKAPPPTPWADAGARGWRLCHDAEEQAIATKRGGPRGGTRATEDRMWARRAAQCPHAPAVLALAAEREIVQGAELLAGVEDWDAEGQHLSQVAQAHEQSMRRALGWLSASISESTRRGAAPPPEAYYYRAYALTTLGEAKQARRAIEVAARHRDAATHRLDRMAALTRLFAGDLEGAMRLAHRAVVDAPADGDRLISRFIYALVMDRAGASYAASQELAALARDGGRYQARVAVESVLPVHERLFLRALDHQAGGRRSHAVRVWKMYLARPEPERAERVLAGRHEAELQPRPPLVEGPQH